MDWEGVPLDTPDRITDPPSVSDLGGIGEGEGGLVWLWFPPLGCCGGGGSEGGLALPGHGALLLLLPTLLVIVRRLLLRGPVPIGCKDRVSGKYKLYSIDYFPKSE